MGAKTILVVDDDLSVLETVDYILTSDGYNVLLASNGQDGLDIIGQQWVDCIILDLRMPQVSGYLFTNLAIKESKNPKIKIMLLTGDSLMAGNCKITLPNVHQKISKPFDINELKQSVSQLLR